jgi:hypothetical protein
VKGTFTPKLSNMLGTHTEGTASRPPTAKGLFVVRDLTLRVYSTHEYHSSDTS